MKHERCVYEGECVETETKEQERRSHTVQRSIKEQFGHGVEWGLATYALI